MNVGNRVRGLRGWCVVGSAALAVVLAGCGGGSGTPSASSVSVDTVLKMPDLKGQTVVVNTYGGSFADTFQKDVVKPFEAATGAKVVLSTNCCDAFATQVQGGQFAGDVEYGQGYGPTQAWGDAGLLKSDPRLAQIAKARGVNPDLQGDRVVPIAYTATVLAWNTKIAGNDHPTSWAEFFDTSKFKGTRGMAGTLQVGGNLEVAELATGTPTSSVYPIDTNKAIAGLTALRKNAPVHFWPDATNQVNQLGNGDVAYSLGYSERIFQGIKKGLPVDMTFDHALVKADAAAIPATAKNVDGAVALIDFAMSPKIQAAMAQDYGLAPAYPKAAEMVDPSVRKYMATDPSNIGQVIFVDEGWWQKNNDSAHAAFTKWLTQG